VPTPNPMRDAIRSALVASGYETGRAAPAGLAIDAPAPWQEPTDDAEPQAADEPEAAADDDETPRDSSGRVLVSYEAFRADTDPQPVPTPRELVEAALADPEIDPVSWASWITSAPPSELAAAFDAAGVSGARPPSMFDLPPELRRDVEQARIDARIQRAQENRR
jgi:hypothetical protein